MAQSQAQQILQWLNSERKLNKQRNVLTSEIIAQGPALNPEVSKPSSNLYQFLKFFTRKQFSPYFTLTCFSIVCSGKTATPNSINIRLNVIFSTNFTEIGMPFLTFKGPNGSLREFLAHKKVPNYDIYDKLFRFVINCCFGFCSIFISLIFEIAYLITL